MPRKRRSFSATFKSKVALDAIKGLKTVAEIAKLHQVHPSQVALWKRQLLEGVESVFDGPTDRKDKALPQNLWVKGSNISRMEAFGFFAFPR
jgi:transposase-like protein